MSVNHILKIILIKVTVYENPQWYENETQLHIHKKLKKFITKIWAVEVELQILLSLINESGDPIQHELKIIKQFQLHHVKY